MNSIQGFLVLEESWFYAFYIHIIVSRYHVIQTDLCHDKNLFPVFFSLLFCHPLSSAL